MQLLVQPFLIKLIFIFILFNKYFFCFVRQLQRSIHTEYGSVNNFINRCLSSHVLAQKMHSVLQGKGGIEIGNNITGIVGKLCK